MRFNEQLSCSQVFQLRPARELSPSSFLGPTSELLVLTHSLRHVPTSSLLASLLISYFWPCPYFQT